MCSIGEDDFGDEGGAHAMVQNEKINGFTEDVMCKCGEGKCVIKIELKTAMCQKCFLLFVRHKFRASLGATKIIPRGAKVLLNFSGSAADVCLLSMAKLGIDDFSFKKLCLELEVIYLDESCITASDLSDIAYKLEVIGRVKKVLAQFEGIKCRYSSIADEEGSVVDLDEVTEEYLKERINLEINFTQMFNILKSLTSKQDFLERTRTQKLRKVAQSLACTFIFISDISITIAKRLMQNVSLGRGSSVANDVSFCDDRLEPEKILRPLKDLSELEVNSYNKFNGLISLPITPFGSDAGQFASIQNLTSSFVDGLQENFSGTVSTVFRSCSKIAPQQTTSEAKRCLMCASSLDYENSNTLFAIEFSRVVSELADQQLESVEKCEEKARAEVTGKQNSTSNLCHGCRNIFIGLSDDELREIL